jgi:hypothetical protein
VPALVIVGCGYAKRDEPSPAFELYTGGYFRQTLAYARTLASDDRILILSGKHGLLRGHRVIAPYEQRIGQPGAITTEQVVAQARAMGLSRERNVTALVGADYARTVRAVWPTAVFPLGPLGLFARMKWLAEQVRKAGEQPCHR